jgi:Bifunctional DNA primase/polymerase, N-terminal
MTDDLLTAALRYAERGWYVFPLRPNDKRPACPAHPADRCEGNDPFCRDGHTGWAQRATTDPARITRAWSSSPYGLAIATGPSALVVVDTDLPKPGQDTPQPSQHHNVACGEDVLAVLADDHSCVVPATYTVRTRSGGTHRYYTHPAGPRLANTTGKLGHLVDTRSNGGYVVAAPTAIDGANYTVTDDRPPAPLPDWLTGLLTPRTPHTSAPAAWPRALPVAGDRTARYVTAAMVGESAKVRGAQPGGRNHTLFCAAVALGQLVAGRALTQDDARQALHDACSNHIAVGAFTEREAMASIASGLRRGANNPRTLAA